MGIGYFFRGKVLLGSCGGLGKLMGKDCDFCENKGKVDGVQQIQMKGGREHCIALYKGEKINTATIEDLIFQDSEVKDLQFQVNRNKEITDEVIEGERSRVFDQAENRMHAQQALLACLIS